MSRTQKSIDRLQRERRLDAMSAPMQTIAVRLDERAGAVLRGDWLGHPLHPALTDLPVGFWTSSFMLDFLGGRSARPAAQRLIALGILSVIPTAATGLVDWNDTTKSAARRVGVVHAVCNISATLLYGLSWRERRRGRHLAGVGLGVVGATAATIGGYLGGHLAFASSGGTRAEMAAGAAPPRDEHESEPVRLA